MSLIPEFSIAIALGGILILFILFRFLNSRPGYLSRKNELMEKFQVLRSKSIVIQEALSKDILSGKHETEILTGNFTYKDFLKRIQKNHRQNLSDKNYARLKNTHNRMALRQARKMLSEQESILQDAEAQLKNIL